MEMEDRRKDGIYQHHGRPPMCCSHHYLIGIHACQLIGVLVAGALILGTLGTKESEADHESDSNGSEDQGKTHTENGPNADDSTCHHEHVGSS